MPIGLDEAQAAALAEAAGEGAKIWGDLDNKGGRRSFLVLAPFSIILIVVFGIIYLRDKARGGYKIEHIGASA